jgi:hypothetical protein
MPRRMGMLKIPNRRMPEESMKSGRRVAYFVYTQVEKLPRADVREVQVDFEKAGVQIWNAFNFRQITRVTKVVKNLKQARDGVEATFGAVGSFERNLFLSDWRSLRSAVGRLEGLRFKSPAGKKLFAGMLARWKREATQAYVVKDEIGNPGAGLPFVIAEAERSRGHHKKVISIVHPTTMDAEIRQAVLKLHKAGSHASSIVHLIKNAAIKLRFPMSGALSGKALRLRIRRILSRPV